MSLFGLESMPKGPRVYRRTVTVIEVLTDEPGEALRIDLPRLSREEIAALRAELNRQEDRSLQSDYISRYLRDSKNMFANKETPDEKAQA